MKKEKEIPLKNYILLGIILILTVAITIYFYMWNNAYEESKLNTMILDDNLQVINYNELKDYLIENEEVVIYSSVLGDKEIRNFEKKFKTILEKNTFNTNILYLNLTEELKDNKIKKEINKKYIYEDNNISNVPSIMIIKDGEIKGVYNIKDKKYNIKDITNYLKNEGVMND